MNHDDIPGWDDDGPGWEQLEGLLAMRWDEKFDALYGRKERDEVNVNEMFPSKYLKAADLRNRKVKVVIGAITVEQIGSDTRNVMYFSGRDKGMVLNKTKAMILAADYGPDTDDWLGKEVVLYPTKTQDPKGQMVEAIGVEVPLKESAPGEEPAF